MKTFSKNELNSEVNLGHVGIYVHIPFCNAKCTYCNFNSYVIPQVKKEGMHTNYVDAVVKEIEGAKQKMKGYAVDTIFIGGGTPSVLIGGGITKILNAAKENFSVLECCEITIEVNPNAFSAEQASEWFLAGVNRVSVGLQSANDSILKSVGRTHTVNTFLTTMQTLKSVGFKNLSADLMLGLPGQTVADVATSVKLVTRQKIKHVSAYSLILEDETPLAAMVNSGKISLPSESETVKMYNKTMKMLKKRGFSRYEVSNFAKRGYHSKHNWNTWRMKYYLGFGAGAHSFFENVRHENAKGIEEYINKINTTQNAITQNEEILNEQLFEETILLGLRTRVGIDLKHINKTFGIDLVNQKKNILKNFKLLKLIKIKNNHLFLTNKGYYVLNKIILELAY